MEFTKEFVLREFDKNKSELLKKYRADKSPIAILLGGQAASGKSNLLQQVKNEYPEKEDNILFVNGDIYRNYCPNAQKLIRSDKDNYSAKTQIYSNIFTEELIKEAAKNSYNIVIEGTMRNPFI
jgi:Zeta toxin.